MSTERMRMLALSDLHGKGYRSARTLIDEVHPDWLVLLGDILPDFSMISGRGNRLEAQRQHWRIYRDTFIRPGMTTTLVRGNHEIEGFSDPDISRIPERLADRVIRLEGVPAEFGAWGWSREWDEPELRAELEAQLKEAPEPWLCLSHVPPFGLLDRTHSGEHVGHRLLRQWLEDHAKGPTWVLCGHVHEAFGSVVHGRSRILNVAGGFAVLEGLPDHLDLIQVGQLVHGMD